MPEITNFTNNKQFQMAYITLVYLPLLGFGFVANIVLMIVVIRGTPRSLKIYSILIFYEALNDFVVIIADALAFERLIVKLPSFTFVARGPCRLVGANLCNYCNSIMTSGLVESILLQSISFGYRHYILNHPSPRARYVHLVVLLASVPNIFHLVLFKHVKVADVSLFETFSAVYPTTDWTEATFYGIPRLSDPYPAALFAVFFIIIPMLFTYIIITRIRLLRTLRSLVQIGHMSVRKVEVHKLLVKILTIHSLLPLSMIVALIGIGLLVMEIYSEELEAVAYLSAMIAPIACPAVTMYFLTPYRRYLLNSLRPFRSLKIANILIPNPETITKLSTIDIH